MFCTPAATTPAPTAPKHRKTSVRLYYIPNGNDYHIAALLNEMFTEVKPFGCRNVQDYIDRRILAYKTPEASRQMWDEVKAMRPDVVYVESGKNIEPATLQRIRTELGIPVTMWFGDACVNDQFIERLMAYAPCVDRQIVVDRGVAEAAAQRGLQNVEFIPFFGYDHYFHPLNAPKTLEILFSGKSYDGTFAQYPFARERLAFVRLVNAEFGRRLAVVGENWEQFGLANYVPDRVPEWEVNELNNHAKIVLAFDAAHVREFTSCRTYHALLGRSFILIRKFPGIENLFVNGEHLVWFESAEEGIALLHHYLEQPEERERIAEAGYQHVHRNGWKFSNVVRYLIDRGLKRETRNFEEVHAPFSKPLPQRVRNGRELMESSTTTKPLIASSSSPTEAGHRRLSPGAQACLEQAESFFNQDRFEDARAWLERAIDLDPDQLDLLLAFANLSLQLDAAPAAETALSHAITLRPNDNTIRVLLASAQYKQGKVEAFEETLSLVLRSNPADPSAIRFLADLNLQHNRFKDAANGYFKLLQQNENDIESLLSLGVCFFKTGDRAAATMMFERILKLQPDHALARENLAACRGAKPTQTIRASAPESAAVRPATPPTPKASAPPGQRAAQRHISLERYFQPPAGSTERVINVKPTQVIGSTQSAYQALKHYEIRDFGTGLEAASAILAHILKSKLNTPWTAKNDFWPQTLVLPVLCELRTASGAAFDGTQPKSLDDVGLKFATGEETRRADIEQYARQLRAGADLGRPLYVTGALLGKLAPGTKVDPKAIYMMDGARRITASALAHRRSIDALLLMHEDEYAALLQPETLANLRARLASLKWFESYQSIPMLGLRGERTLRRFDLMSLPPLRDAVVMDFGCNTGQACLKAAQAGARQVIGIEGMPDTFAGAQEIAQLAGFKNVRYANINFNDADFARQIDAVWAEPVDYAFFFSVYRTKELTQREQLFRYILSKARKGIFFEGHASAKIDTLEYYEWLFESFGVKGRFLGYSEGELRPLFYIDLAGHQTRPEVREHTGAPSIARQESATTASRAMLGAPLVSAIVSTYNNERFMEGRLRDLVAQTLGERLEIIVVDSGSQENEGAIVKRFMEKHSNIRYIRTEERERIYQAWNRGIHAARGKYITNANTDDRLRRDALEILASELESNPKAALVYADFFITNTENEDFHAHTRTGYSIKPDFAPDIMLDGCHMGPQPMWRRSLHEELGWFDESLFAAGDYDFWCRVATKHPMLHVQEFLGLYLHNAAGICNSNASRTEQETAQVRAKYRSQFPAPRANLPRGFYYRDAVKPGRFVNIGMVTFNRLEFTKRAIPALLEHTDFPYVLTVVDNASTDGTREYLTALKQLGVIKKLVLLDDNVGVAKASNLAWSQEPSAEFYLKLDNDIVIQKPGWLRRMAETLEAVPKLGAVAYSFEPRSYPTAKVDGQVIRPKPGGTLGGACVMIPKRTERALGCWCEDYGLYGEEDFDYGIRILSKGWFNAYMEDEEIGFHLPNGRAAVINDETMDAKDGLEEVVDRDYRQFKDEQRRQQVLSGKRDRYEKEYRNGQRPLFVTSKFVADRNGRNASVPVATAAAASVDALQQPLRVAVFSLDHPATACAVLRIIAPLSRTSRPCQMVWCAKLTKDGAVVDDSAVKHADVVVIQRMFPGPEHQEVLNRVFASGKPIIYELDDWFFDMPADNIHAGYAKTRIPFIQQVIKQARLVTVSTEELRQRMLELHSNVVVLPNLANEQQWAPRPARADGKVIIGYAGTTTHGRDLEMVETALKRIVKKHAGRVGFVFLGCATEKLLKLPGSRLVEFQHGYGKYVETLQAEAIDIALAPLADNPFNRCKSNIKWIEYSAAGIAGVYSDIPAYRGTVRPGETGMLAGTSADDWFNAIDELVTNDSKRSDIAARASESVMQDHSLAAKARLWEAAYTAAAGQSQTPATTDVLAPSRNGKTPRVSIVIPTFNNLALTKQCLAALYQTTPAALAEIIIVDNGSTDGSVPFFEAEQNAGRLRAALNPQNLGFARGCNQGALEARGEFVLFLNNDTQTQPGWLEAMLNATRETQAGVVGCKLLYPDGSIQHAGIEFINGVPDHRFRHAAANAPEVNQRREFDMVTGACFLMPKKLFVDLGGFDEVFRNGVEDVDLCLRVRGAGHKVVYEPEAVVIHHEGKTQGRFNHVTENLKIFFARWKGQFDEQHRFRVPKKPRLQKSEKSLLLTTVGVSWDGSFLDLGSLSHVNRELTAALNDHSQIQLTRLGKNAVPKPFSGMKSIIDCARTLRAQPSKPAQVTVRHAWPPNWERPANGAWVLIQPWEFGSLPKEWVQNLSRVDEVWVPSDYVRRVYVDSGVEARKVHVVPNGIDPKTFRPDAKPMALATKKSFKFLFVGGTILRKGPDVLLKAYLESFTAQDDVCLVIKDFGGQSVYAGQTFEAQVKTAQARPNAPEILYLNDELPPEALPGLYTACDCLVHPYRGEGFGLPVLEAMACGLPVVVTAGGSTDDFATDEFAYRVPSIRKIFGSKVSEMELVKPGWMLEPNHTALVERLKWIAAHRDEARKLGGSASEHVRREWTWERAAQIAAARLQLLNERPRGPVTPVGPRKARTIALPACGKLGHLGEARELFRAGKLLPAWNATVAALKTRPYHPEAFLLLAEIALAAGDSKQAKELADRACRLAPKWKPARQFAKAKHPKSAMARLELPALPRAITDGFSKPRLSVFLITKNEERFIGQCLESVRDIATQIVVMDTGSTDWTKTIAERFGAEMASFDWCDDFSTARNAALEKVTGDWVLMLDADEELMPDQKERLRQMMSDPSAIAWRMPLIDKGREDEGVSQVPRLFRNAPGLFYVGRIHEQIFSSVEVRRQEWGLENKFGEATLLHHGYTQEMVQSRDKIARNLRLLQLAVEELPGEPNLLMNLGLELVRDGRLAEGLEQYAAAFAAMSALPKEQVTPELRESLLMQYASHLVSSKRSAEVVRVLQSPLAKLGGLTASMHWLLGLAFIEQRQFAEGATQMRECLAKRGKPSYAPVNRNILKGGPNHCLALCLSAMKQREPANRAFEAALKEDPGARTVRFDYARFLVEGGHEVDALKWLHQLAMEEPGELRVWQFGGQVALSRPDYLEFAGDWTSEALKQHPDQATIISQRATALMFSGDAEGASALWQRVELTPSVQAALVLCAVLAGRSGAPINQAQAASVNQEFINWYRRLLEFNAESLVATLHRQMQALRRMVPAAAQLIESAMNEVNAVPSK
ncbi:MAG: glycosyltransferase [Verrucomicrobia bacterium]|nr:glycosyltransferase [Verrucomicrobiota bacterium]